MRAAGEERPAAAPLGPDHGDDLAADERAVRRRVGPVALHRAPAAAAIEADARLHHGLAVGVLLVIVDQEQGRPARAERVDAVAPKVRVRELRRRRTVHGLEADEHAAGDGRGLERPQLAQLGHEVVAPSVRRRALVTVRALVLKADDSPPDCLVSHALAIVGRKGAERRGARDQRKVRRTGRQGLGQRVPSHDREEAGGLRFRHDVPDERRVGREGHPP